MSQVRRADRQVSTRWNPRGIWPRARCGAWLSSVAFLCTVVGPGAFAQPPDGLFTRGVWTLELRSGTFVIREGSTELSRGLFRRNENELILSTDGAPFEISMFGEKVACESSASARYRVAVEDTLVHWTAVEDECAVRRQVFDASIWKHSDAPSPTDVSSELPRMRARPADTLIAGAWPSFRGPRASGVSKGSDPPVEWNGETGEGLAFKVELAGLAHSSPVIWGELLFVTSAVSEREDASFRPGLYGDGDASDDRSVHQWTVSAFELQTGRRIWHRVAVEGSPRDRRHIKSTYASATPATDGKRVVALFGSQGLYAFDLKGTLLWSRSLGRMDLGAYDIPSFEWGPASSPILWRDAVIVQCDTQHESFLMALDAATGESLWRSARDELPSWGTPNVYESPERVELVTNGANFVRGYDPFTGRELWRLGGSSKITAPTPIFTDELVIVASGRRPEKPIFVIRPGGRGDLTLSGDASSSEHVRWQRSGRGPYMPTPLVHEGILYVLSNNGIFDAYDVESGREIYRERVPHSGSGFSASPVAADGRLYLSNEDGDIVVVRAGERFEHLATNPMGEPLMATPAISGDSLYVRGAKHLFGVGKQRPRRAAPP